jgi:hypothetical protein
MRRVQAVQLVQQRVGELIEPCKAQTCFELGAGDAEHMMSVLEGMRRSHVHEGGLADARFACQEQRTALSRRLVDKRGNDRDVLISPDQRQVQAAHGRDSTASAKEIDRAPGQGPLIEAPRASRIRGPRFPPRRLTTSSDGHCVSVAELERSAWYGTHVQVALVHIGRPLRHHRSHDRTWTQLRIRYRGHFPEGFAERPKFGILRNDWSELFRFVVELRVDGAL